ESAGFAEIVDFLRGSNLRYALTTNPIIYDSLVKQFWQTAIANTKADGSLEINATIDTIRSKSGGWDQFGSKFEKQDKVFDVSSFSANDFEYSNRKQTPLSSCQENDVVAPSKPSSSTPPLPSTSSPQTPTPPPIPTLTPPPIPTPTPPPIPTPTPTPIPDTKPTPFEHIYEEQSPVHQHFSPP
ncbi:hypothetical protein Tco_0805766, partial [Tanacetum coccineum]